MVPLWKMQLRDVRRAQRIESRKEDSQGSFQIKAGHALVLELGVSHKQVSHGGKSNKLHFDSSASRAVLVMWLLRFPSIDDGS